MWKILFVILPFERSTFCLFYLLIVLPFVILPFVSLPFVILPFVILPFVREPNMDFKDTIVDNDNRKL